MTCDRLRGYKHPELNIDEIEALKEAMKFAYGSKYYVDEEAEEKDDPFSMAARKTAEEGPEKQAEAVDEAVERAAEREKYVPVNPQAKEKPKQKGKKEEEAAPAQVEKNQVYAPGEDVDPSDIAALRAMLSGGSK